MFSKRLFLASSLVIALLASMPVSAQQLAVPVGDVNGNDVSKGGFKATSGNNLPLWPDVDEKVSLDDADYIYSGKSASTAELFLSDPTDPNIGTGHIIRFKARRTGGAASVELQLLESGVLRATTGVRTPSNPNTWEEIPYTLLEAEADAIGNYNNLTMRIISSSVGNGDEIEITWIELEVPTETVPPGVGSPTYANVTHDSAVLGGTVTDLGTPASLTGGCGVVWGLAPGNWPNRVPGAVPCSAVDDAFTVQVDGLPSSDEIYFRAWANNGQDGYSLEGGPFTTAAPVVKPTVTTTPATEIGQNSARLGGNVTDDGGEADPARGIYWNTVSPAEAGTKVGMGIGLGNFSQVVGSMPAGKPIFFRAYADNSAGEALGGELTFTTLDGPPTVDSATVTDIKATTADLGGTMSSNGGEAPSACGIEWGTTAGGPYPNSETFGVCVEGVPFAVNDVPGLPTGTPVYFRAWATNSYGTAYSPQGTPFTPAGPPVVTATAATDILLRSATLGGTVTSDGGSPVLSQGIIWDTVSPPETAGTSVPMQDVGGSFSGTVENLPLDTDIFWKAYATNSVETGYSGQETFRTLSEPTVQASNLKFDRVSGRALKIKWDRGNGDGVIVVMRLAATGRTDPQDGDDYTGNPDFSVPPPELPVNSNNFVVFKGSGTSVVVTGLTMTTDYTVAVYEYAGTGIDTDYLLTPLVEATQQTYDYAVHNLDYSIECKECHKHGDFGARGDLMKAACVGCHVDLGLAETKQMFDNHLAPDSNPAEDYVDCGVCHEVHNHTKHPTTGAPLWNSTLSTNSITLQRQHNKSFLRANVDKYIETAATPAFLHTDQPKREADNANQDPVQPAITPERAVEGGDATSARGYCQVCHTMTNYHRNNVAADTPAGGSLGGFMQCHEGEPTNNPNTTCASEVHCGDCHEHVKGFVGINNNLPCEQCHNQSGQGSRPIITTQFDLQSKHIPGGSADATMPNCLVCHDHGTHTTGYVRGLDADDGTTSWTHASPRQDTLATGVGEVYEPHCLSCHDDGSADSLPGPAGELTPGQTVESPFTNSAKPPVIGDAVWQGSSHDRPTAGNPTGPLGPNPVSCVGGGTNGCHASGHGTDELNLLAPIPTDSEISSKRSRQCTNCHKSGGVSSKDIKTAFQPDAAATEAIYQTQAASGHLANRRHDIFDTDQTYSSASGDGSTATSLACADCHNVHADNATSPVQNPDTGSPLQPYAPATWATADDVTNNDVGEDPTFGATEPDMIEFCLACHDGAGGTQQAGSSQLPNGMYDMAATYVGDFHGANYGGTGGNGFLKPPFLVDTKYAPMQCTQCHGAHGSDNIFNLRSSITVGAGTASETVMQTGGFAGKGDMGSVVGTTYDLRCATVNRTDDPDCDLTGTQEMFGWGAWCSFCHNMEQHGLDESKSCNTGHRHGGGKM